MLKKILYFIPIVIICILLFVFSAENGEVSGNKSKSFIKNIANFTCTILEKVGIIDEMPSDEQVNGIVRTMEYPVRKLAHISLYLFMSITVLFVLCKKTKMKYSHACLVCMAFCIGVGFLDEFHQLFVDGRSGEFLDVLIDSGGALLGILVYDLFRYINKSLIH